ncbi:damage-inducible protein CinA [Hymenobacter sp. DG25B]|uniref:competence/damage-inducible protein A n=1 Tax=Hymenobacter sp. DG25B TaxID=1385664 RepID=UPI000540DFA8|nr:competence/damage-inducible protein A [Hymenobacter sp. DG25B]AIZ63822.1 damage-inducible protein CinA [Hymenobacter sp. DG25B]
MTHQVPNAEIITIGDELLYGQVIDTNSAFLGQELGKLGIRVRQISSVSDRAEEIVQALDAARQRATLVLITGGLGPTKDDLTKNILTEYFGTELVLHEPSLQDVEAIFARYNRSMLEVNLQQAFLPASCTPIRNVMGTAPGMWFEDRGVVFVSMPGVPFEMKRMMTDIVLPKLKEHFHTPAIEHVVIQTVGLGESFLAERIADWEDALPANIRLAYLPYMGGVRLRLTGTDDGQPHLRERMRALLPALREKLGQHIFAEGEVSLEAAVGELLRERNLTVGTAESCTGGYVAHRLTSVPGCSAYFKGSIVAYDNTIKINDLNVTPESLATHGAVSEAVVRQMAEGLRQHLQVDVALATSGIAGPDGGTPEKPVGTIWIAYADAHHTVSRLLSFNRGRQLNIEYTTTVVLDMLRMNLPAVAPEATAAQ